MSKNSLVPPGRGDVNLLTGGLLSKRANLLFAIGLSVLTICSSDIIFNVILSACSSVDRATASGAVGQEFDSPQARHFPFILFISGEKFIMKNPLQAIIETRRKGIKIGVPSYCTANALAIEALLEQAMRFDEHILIEGTANQINQFGGYTGMTPEKFRDYVFSIADKINFDKDKIILGADHFGPLAWANLPANEAMNNAKELVRLATLAGFTKIHLDTSMRLADDPEVLSNEIMAERAATLLEECEKAYQLLLKENPAALRPVYVIGSEVPIPGGTQDDDEGLHITDPKDFEETLKIYQKKFYQHGLAERWQDVIAVVVQPGVEFGDKSVHPYDPRAAFELCNALKNYPGLVFEGHSTDYQTPEKLREMVIDGIAILKVGPALTFALREGLFALSFIEQELVPEDQRANFIGTLEKIMLANPGNWQKHYHGSEAEKKLARKYSYSDRARYYFNAPEVQEAIKKLFKNLNAVEIPAGMLRQYMPRQYKRVREGLLTPTAEALAKDSVVLCAEDYNFAVKINYAVLA